jgi:hypothetical protein
MSSTITASNELDFLSRKAPSKVGGVEGMSIWLVNNEQPSVKMHHAAGRWRWIWVATNAYMHAKHSYGRVPTDSGDTTE